MTFNPNAHRGTDGFPVDRPLDALKADHDLVRQLFDSYLKAQDSNEKRDIGSELLMRLEVHMTMEEGVFYPKVRQLDAQLVDDCDAEHQEAKVLMDSLRTMDAADPQAAALFGQLFEQIRNHLDTEEGQLFPRILQSHLDLVTLGTEMQSYETSILASRSLPGQQPGMRQ